MISSIFVCHGGPTLVEVVSKLQSMLRNKGIESRLDKNRGLDHGAWDVLYLMYPNANIPVVQVSVNPYLSMEKQYEIGRVLRDLVKEDIIVIGSGSTVHNLAEVNWNADRVEEWAAEFDNWFIEKVEKNDMEVLFSYRQTVYFSILDVCSGVGTKSSFKCFS